MPADRDSLGGRLSLFDPDSLGPEQRQLYDRCRQRVVPWSEQAGFQAATEDGRLIGPFNATLLNPKISSALLEWQREEERCTSLSARARQIVILTVGAVWQAPYELYAHSALARSVGLSEDEIAALIDGGLPGSLAPEESVVQRTALALTVDRQIDDALYREAESALGTEGIFALVNLLGANHTVCALLNAFAIPAPQ